MFVIFQGMSNQVATEIGLFFDPINEGSLWNAYLQPQGVAQSASIRIRWRMYVLDHGRPCEPLCIAGLHGWPGLLAAGWQGWRLVP